MRVYNFGAGPATLPEELLIKAQADCLNWNKSGMSVLEISHRSPEFIALLDQTEALMRELLSIPNTYQVLFIGAPARFHFASVPLNFLKNQADYIVSGTWSEMAAAEAKKIGNITIAASGVNSNYLNAPETYQYNKKADYCYFTPNETLTGLRLPVLPERPSNVPLIADMTSCLLSEEININDYSMIIAGAQKNLAPSGLSIVIIKQAFLDTINSNVIPSFLDYRVHANNRSNYATPPSFNIYMANLMLKWLKEQGGISTINQINKQKAALLYQVIDNSSFYHCAIKKAHRSIMNVAFSLVNESLNQKFLDEAQSKGLVALKGHRNIGGMRASIYNAMTMEGVSQLVAFMLEFEQKNIN